MKIKIDSDEAIPYQTKIKGLKIILVENNFLKIRFGKKKLSGQKKFMLEKNIYGRRKNIWSKNIFVQKILDPKNLRSKKCLVLKKFN